MDYIVADSPHSGLWLAIFAVSAVLMVAGVVLIPSSNHPNSKRNDKLKPILSLLCLTLGAMIFAGTLTYSLFFSPTNVSNFQSQRMELIEETYGINLAKEQYIELAYPESMPANKPEIFGSTEGGVLSKDLESLSYEKITLVWTGEELRLYGGETQETMKELPRSSD